MRKTPNNTLRDKLRKEFPYHPPKEFIDKAMAELRGKEVKWPDEVIRNAVLNAYWERRKEILAKAK